MQFQLQDTASLLSIIIVLCFSFCILIMTYWFKNAEILHKLMGYSFISTFFLNFIAVIANDHELSAAFSQTSEPMLLLLITLMLAAKPDKKKYVIYRLLLIILPAILLLTVVCSFSARSFMASQLTSLSASVAISTIALYLLKNKKGDMNLVFWSILPLLASGFAKYYLTFGISVFIVPFLQLGAYIILMIFFYRVFLKSQLIKVEEAEKKLTAIDRSINYEVKRRMLEIEKVNQNLLSISKTDAMSKVLNKTALLDSIESLMNRKTNTEFSILMFDIDNFKTINDTLGHVVGDKCIKMLAATVRNNIRDFDMIGRYGGDEFAVVLPETGTNQAILIAERFRQRVEASNSPHYTVSIGVASYPADGSDVKALIEAADDGLYKSKHKGRNAVSHKNFY